MTAEAKVNAPLAADDLDALDELTEAEVQERQRDPGGALAVQLWLAGRRLGLGCTAGRQVLGGPEAGPDEGALFFVFVLEGGIELALRQDGLRAYLTAWDPTLLPAAILKEKLVACGLEGVAIDAKPAADRWLQVAEGRPPEPVEAEGVTVLHPQEPGKPVAMYHLVLLSGELQSLLSAKELDEEKLAGAQAIAAVPGEVLVRLEGHLGGAAGTDVFGDPMPAPVRVDEQLFYIGEGLHAGGGGQYSAARYGYLCLVGQRFDVVPPLRLSLDLMEVHWVMADPHKHLVTAHMIEQALEELGIVDALETETIRATAKAIGAGEHSCRAVAVAAGQRPQDGRDAEVDMLVDVERRVGQEREDGSVDFRQINLVPNVKAGDVVARRRRHTPGKPGRDVLGRALEARDGQDRPLKAGDNVERREDGDREEFVATTDGFLKHQGETLSVVQTLVIKGNVDYNTGNLDFDGDIFIGGSVIQGFAVKATGDVTVAAAVEAGAEIKAHGDIAVGGGVVGRKTLLAARGNVRAQFVQEAKVVTGGDIVLGAYGYHADLRAGRCVKVQKGAVERGGNLIGGETWALELVDTHLAGSAWGRNTVLGAGMSPQHAAKLDDLKRRIESCNQQMNLLLGRFGLTTIDVEQICNRVAASTGPRRKVLARHAKNLAHLAQIYRELLLNRRELEQKLTSSLAQARIRVWDKVLPGVVIRLGEQSLKATEPIRNVCFRLSDGKLVAR